MSGVVPLQFTRLRNGGCGRERASDLLGVSRCSSSIRKFATRLTKLLAQFNSFGIGHPGSFFLPL